MIIPLSQLFSILPELVLLGMICVCTVLEVYKKNKQGHLVYYASQISLIVVTLLLLFGTPNEASIIFNGELVQDLFGQIIKLFICIAVFSSFMFSRNYLQDRDCYRGEFYILGLLGTLGMLAMVSSGNFIVLYISLEVSALAMYSMIAIRTDDARAIEAAIKYFILGSMASGILLFGVSMIYGATGSIQFSDILLNLQTGPTLLSSENELLLYMGVTLLLVGLVFKIGGAPFHLWMPDVYDGAPTAVTVFLVGAPKLAVFAIIYRTLAEGLLPAVHVWQDLLLVVAILSLIIGNVIAIAQTSLKRMLAYSTVSHVGFIFMGFLVATESGFASSLFYVLFYSIMAIVAFGIMIVLSNKNIEVSNISDLKGLIRRNPYYAIATAIIMFSLAGIPPTGGFYAKFQILEAVVNVELEWLAILAVIMSIIGAFYYLRVVKYVMFDQPSEGNENVISAKPEQKVLFIFLSLLILLIGIFPSQLINWCNLAISPLT